jgi:hypothetical protein
MSVVFSTSDSCIDIAYSDLFFSLGFLETIFSELKKVISDRNLIVSFSRRLTKVLTVFFSKFLVDLRNLIFHSDQSRDVSKYP